MKILKFLLIVFFVSTTSTLNAFADEAKMKKGLEIFNETAACSACHMLKAAASEGNIGPNLGKYAWRQFVLETTLSAGTYNIASLASNGSDKQPELRMENRRGYAHNGWKDHSVNITVV